MARKNAFYAQSGGVTAVINASACGVLQTARQHSKEIGKVYAGRNGIIGGLTAGQQSTSRGEEPVTRSLLPRRRSRSRLWRMAMETDQPFYSLHFNNRDLFDRPDLGRLER